MEPLTRKLIFFLLARIVLSQPPNFDPAQMDFDYLASLELCRFFHGVCDANCTRYYQHRWGVPLCPQEGHKCCAPPAEGSSSNNSSPTPAPTTVITTTLSSTTTAAERLASLNSNAEVAGGFTIDAGQNFECGRYAPVHRRKRIVGGSVAHRGAWPWLVALRSALGGHVCGGALVGQKWVITAAHCFRQFASPTMWRIRTGEYHLIHTDDGERDIPVSNIFIYPDYQFNYTGSENSSNRQYARYKHDIALVKLGENANTTPICLAQPDFGDREENQSGSGPSLASGGDPYANMNAIETKGECWVSGWGYSNGANSDLVMRQVHADLVGHRRCGEMWNTHLDDDMICFGDGLHGPCQGDSGGPLSCRHEGKFYLTGVVSWGTENCDVGGYPSVFTRVNAYHDWIQSVINEESG